MPGLFDLPVELVLHILDDVEPIDLLNLSEVCKLWTHTLADRAVWECAVQRIYRQNSLFEPSFSPLHSMDLDGLKRAALRPHKLGGTFEYKASTTLCPHPEQLLRCNVNDGSRNDFIRVQIVPGGRYVIGLAGAYLCMWDIGSPGSIISTDEGAILLDIAHAHPSHGAYQTMTFPSRHSDHSFRFATHSHDGEENQRIQVYEAGPLPGCPRLRLLSELCLEGDVTLSCFWVSGDKAYIHRHSYLFAVWDFVRSEITSWNLRRGGQPYEMFNIDDVVILLQEEGLRAWKSPTLQPTEPSFTLLEFPLEAINPLVYQWQDPSYSRTRSSRDTTRWFVPSKWTGFSPGVQVVINTLTATSPPMFQMRALGVEVSPANFDVRVGIQQQRQRSVVEGPEVETLLGYTAFSPRPYSTCGCNCYVVGSADDVLFIHHSTSQADGRGWKTARCRIGHRLDVASLLCPYSGRLAYVCQGGHEDGYNRIHVVNLLAP